MQTDRSVAEDITRRGMEALRRGEATEAIGCFTDLIGRDSGNCAANVLLARAYRLHGDDKEEGAAIDRALEWSRTTYRLS